MKTYSKIQLAVVVMTTVLELAGLGQVRAAQLVQYWPFNEGSGGTATNAVAGGNTAQLVGEDPSVAWSSDVPSQLKYSTRSVSLDGTNGYFNLGNLHLTGSATVSLWAKPANFDAGDIRLFSQVPYASPYAGTVRIDPFTSGDIQVNDNGPWRNLGTASLFPAGSWTHLAFVFDAGVAQLYINGVPSSQPVYAFSGFDFSAAGFGLGARFDVGGAIGGPYGNAYPGLFDDVSVWNGPLSSNSIALLANGTSPQAITDTVAVPPAAHLVQYFPLDDGTGSSTASNAVPGGLTGQLVNADPNTAWSANHPAQLSGSVGSVSLAGLGDYVDLGNFGIQDQGTISLWIKPTTVTSSTGAGIRLYSEVTTDGSLPTDFSGITAIGLLPSGVLTSGSVTVYNAASGSWNLLAPVSTVPANSWTHLAFVYSPGRCTLFINGQPYLKTTAGFAFAAADFGLGAQLGVGVSGGPFGQAYAGLMDDFSLWDHALQPSSIVKLASGQKPTTIVDSPTTEPPFIYQNPVSQTNVATYPVTMNVVAAGAGILAYQWYLGPTPVGGATNSSYTIAATQLSDAGNYTVVVTNSFGSVTSLVATLTVDPGVPVITSQPSSLGKRVGTVASFTVSATGSQPLRYQWQLNNSPISNATNATYTIASIVNGDAGSYTVAVTNNAGAVTSQVAVLSLILTPAAVNVDLAFDTNFMYYTGTGAAPDPSTTWNEAIPAALAADDNQMALVNSDGLPSAITFFASPTNSSGQAWSPGYNGGGNNLQQTYWHIGSGNVTPSFGFQNLDPATKYDVYVYGIATDFGLGWTEQINMVGGPSQPLTIVPNTGFPVLGQDYVVFRGITGVSNVMFTAGSLGDSTVFSTVTGLQIIESIPAPQVVNQPIGGLARVGGSFSFSVTASGAEPLRYQWYHNGSPIAGASLTNLAVGPIQPTDAGPYFVVVTNQAGSATSQVAQLTLQFNPPAVNVNLIRDNGQYTYAGPGAAVDTGVNWNNVCEADLETDPNREMTLTDSDGNNSAIIFYAGSFGAPDSGNFGNNGGGNNLQATYWHVGAGNVSPPFGFYGLDPQKSYSVFVFGIAQDFGTGFSEQISMVGGSSQPLKPIPNTGFPVPGEDYVVFRGITGVTNVLFTAGKLGGATVFSTVTGLQIQEIELPVIAIARAGSGQVTISWTGLGTLEQADAVIGGWTVSTNQGNPQTIAAPASKRFYRIRQ